MNLIENLNTILWALFGVLSVVEAVLYWGLPSFRKNPGNAGMVETLDSFWIAMAVALSLKAVWVQPFTIPSGSMEDTLQVGDYILVKKYEYGYSFLNMTPRFVQFKKPQRGEVVVFVYPDDHSKDFIKRCRGVPGDVLLYKDKVLYVNGERQAEPFVKHIDPRVLPRGEQEIFESTQKPDMDSPLGSDPTATRDNFGPVTILPGHYFMMGDNRDNSWDSRYWGQLDENLIKGRAWFIYWHSVGFADFLALGALAVGVVSILLMALDLLTKRSASPAEAADAKARADNVKNHLLTIVVCLAIAGVVIGAGGIQSFKDGCQVLRDRMFTGIK